jgi:hypothetical protein
VWKSTETSEEKPLDFVRSERHNLKRKGVLIMNLRKYFLCAAVALAAFILSCGLIDFGRYLQTLFKAEEKREETVRTLTVEEITYPHPVVKSEISRTEEQIVSAEPEFYTEGDFYIIGDLPKGFKDFRILRIITHDYEKASVENNYEGVPIPPEGYLEAKKEFNFTRIKIADKKISFETETKGGISYRFVGEFIEAEMIEVKDKDGEYTDYVVLKGRLKKMRDGKNIAESEIKLAIAHSC